MFTYRTRTFTRWMRKEGVTDIALRQATMEMAQGRIDADLGWYLLEKRAARWIFLCGFEKNEGTNIYNDELKVLQEVNQQEANRRVRRPVSSRPA